MPLTKEQAIEIYRLATENQLKNTHIAAQVGCDEATVRKIKRKERWKDATDEFDAGRNAPSMGNGGGDFGQALPRDDVGSGSGADSDAGSPAEEAGRGDAEACHGELLADDLAEGQDAGANGNGDSEGGGACGGELGSADAAAGGQPVTGCGSTPSAVGVGRIDATMDEQGRVTATFTDPGQFVVFRGPWDQQSLHAAPQPADPFLAPDGSRDFWPGTVPPPVVRRSKVTRSSDPDAPKRPLVPDGLLPKEAEVLIAAKRYGVVRIAGAYGGTVTTPEKIKDPREMAIAERNGLREIAEQFHPERAVMRQVHRKFLAPGEHANTFVLTDAGRVKLAEFDAYLDAMERWERERLESNRRVRKARSAEIVARTIAAKKAKREAAERDSRA